MLMFGSTPPVSMSPTPPQIADLRLAASHMTGATRRAFQAEMTLKYCAGNARRAADIFGWGRHNMGTAKLSKSVWLGGQGPPASCVQSLFGRGRHLMPNLGEDTKRIARCPEVRAEA